MDLEGQREDDGMNQPLWKRGEESASLGLQPQAVLSGSKIGLASVFIVFIVSFYL